VRKGETEWKRNVDEKERKRKRNEKTVIED
jgi:hypothetical protein